MTRTASVHSLLESNYTLEPMSARTEGLAWGHASGRILLMASSHNDEAAP